MTLLNLACFSTSTPNVSSYSFVPLFNCTSLSLRPLIWVLSSFILSASFVRLASSSVLVLTTSSTLVFIPSRPSSPVVSATASLNSFMVSFALAIDSFPSLNESVTPPIASFNLSCNWFNLDSVSSYSLVVLSNFFIASLSSFMALRKSSTLSMPSMLS